MISLYQVDNCRRIIFKLPNRIDYLLFIKRKYNDEMGMLYKAGEICIMLLNYHSMTEIKTQVKLYERFTIIGNVF